MTPETPTVPKKWTAKEVESKVIEIVKEQLRPTTEEESKVVRSASFVETLGADSLDAVEIVMELEDCFDIKIPDDEAKKMKTVGETIDWICSNLRTAGRLIE